MDLRTGVLLWPALSSPLSRSAGTLDRDESCDTLIVGAGVSGAIAALLLAEAGQNVIVIDRRQAVHGSTPASTALVQYDIDTPLVKLADRLGAADAQAVYRATYRANSELARLIRRRGIPCDLEDRPGLYLASSPNDVPMLQQETESRQAAGIDAVWLDHASLQHRFGIDRPGAIESSVQYQLDPWKLTHGLLALTADRGARVYSQTEIAVESTIGAAPRVQTTGGHSIACRDIVFATGYETPEYFQSVNQLCRLHSTYVLASSPVDPAALWPRRALLWEHADPYLYVRTTPDHRILAGGEDEDVIEPAARDALIPRKIRDITARVRQLLPDLRFDCAYAWAGAFASTDDGLPLIGLLDPSRRCHFALAYGGNGITFSYLAAELIRDDILRRQNPLIPLFGIGRTSLKNRVTA